jgi:hypothetical protein
MFSHAIRNEQEVFPLAAGYPALFPAWELIAGLAGFFLETLMRILKECKQCGNTFLADSSEIKRGRGLYCGRYCAFISLRKNNIQPIFSEEDQDMGKIHWHANSDGYPMINVQTGTNYKTRKAVKAHRIVLSRMLNRQLSTSDICDHINHDKMDNRRQNLRLCSWQENCLNRDPATHPSRGASYHKYRRKWQARCRVGKEVYCGLWDTKEEAMKASEQKRQELIASTALMIVEKGGV